MMNIARPSISPPPAVSHHEQYSPRNLIPAQQSHNPEYSNENEDFSATRLSPTRLLPALPIDHATHEYEKPLPPAHMDSPTGIQYPQTYSSQVEIYTQRSGHARPEPSGHYDASLNESKDLHNLHKISQALPYRQRRILGPAGYGQQSQTADRSPRIDSRSNSPRIVIGEIEETQKKHTSHDIPDDISRPSAVSPLLQYHHQSLSEINGNRLIGDRTSRVTFRSSASSTGSPNLIGDDAGMDRRLSPSQNQNTGTPHPRPASAHSSRSDFGSRDRNRSPQLSPNQHARTSSAQSRRSPDNRPISYVDLLNVPYPQPPPAPTNFDNTQLRTAVGNNASLLSTMKTLEMYRANVKKTNDPAIQYEFAIFMINTVQETAVGTKAEDIHRNASSASGSDLDGPSVEGTPGVGSQSELLREARHILQRLSDRSYPFAQYYLADGYSSGLFNKGKEDYDRGFPLFVAASKHGHAEAGYRAALCYEYGWGTRKDPQKAVQFYRQSASKNHPGAMLRLARACLDGEMGLANRQREGLKWLKRAAESADFQYNSAPYELGCLHITGDCDDVFKDESYAAQLFTQSADLGHAEASFKLGEAYEHGMLNCPKDPALSVHFYTGAAQRGHAVAMMALCAWYLVGADPVLEKDENEAYEWARKSAECGFPKAEYAVGYFTEMGIGCRRDPLEANVWYVKAADDGDPRAKHRIAAIRAAASGGQAIPQILEPSRASEKSKAANSQTGKADEEKAKSKRWGLF